MDNTSPTEQLRPPPDPDRWLELVEAESTEALKAELQDHHPADIAAVLEQLPYDIQLQLFSLLDSDAIADVIVELDELDQSRLLKKYPAPALATIIEKLDSDDAADLLGVLKDERAAATLDHLKEEDRAELTELMSYHEESAGGIMAKEALSANEDARIEDVITLLRSKAAEVGDIYYTYVTDDDGRLVGYLSLKRLILAQPDHRIGEIMKTDVVHVNVGMDREEVAGLFRKYDLASAPVVDDQGRFLGRITHDDILEVMHEEAHEDLARLTGQAQFDPGERSLLRNLKIRLPWLLLGLLGGIIAAQVIAGFEPQLSSLTSLIFFLPLVAAMGGNAGIQTSSLMVRGLATGEIGSYGLRLRLLGEVGVALLAGLICSAVLFLITLGWQHNMTLAFVVSLSLLVVIILAAVIGAIVPLALKKFGFDPALATGPFITTTNDIIGLFIYLGIATFFLTKL